MSAVFDYISGTKDGEEARLAAISEYTAAHLGTALTENEQLRAEIASLRDTLKLKESELAALDKSHADLGHRLADMGREALEAATKFQDACDEIASLRAALQFALAAMTVASQVPAIIKEYDFDPVIAETQSALEQQLK